MKGKESERKSDEERGNVEKSDIFEGHWWVGRNRHTHTLIYTHVHPFTN